ncbi:potassium/proton antiporter [Sneathiella chinensis]|uniref:K+/H+ antiporter n=1 Tax=Sneathiella chinensis TaxID=349750 RepID=A0ABQ5U310_9PROT|nr:potassium/proton antiporter [Sneathiella chinensis]GLQ06555.1 K+/H+ antiporter [Sneathiella chinensis]
MTETIALATLICAGLVVISVFTSLISFRVGAPLLLVFLCIGLIAGEDGIGGIAFENAPVAYFVGSISLAVILFDSGFGTRLKTFRVAAAPAILLATIGVVLTALLIAIPTRYLLDLSWLEALLLGAIVGSTDAAAVFFLLRVGGIHIRDRIRSVLEVESGSNDPMAIFLTVTLVEMAMAGGEGQQVLSWDFLNAFVTQMGLGIACGLGFSFLAVHAINRIRLEPSLYPIIILGFALSIFGATSLLGGSGFLAVYISGLVMGNMELTGSLTLRRFQEGLTWIAQITMFLMLGLLATPSAFPAIAWQAVVIGLLLMLVARPVAIWLCLMPFGFKSNETTFIAWVGLRGAVSVLMGILPIVGGLESGQTLFNAAFIIVLTSLLLQGWTVRPLAKWLGLIIPPDTGAVEKIELELPGNANHELVSYRIAEDCPVSKGERIPRWARPSLVVRNDRSMQMHEAGRPQPGDYVYIFVPPRLIPLLDRLFASELVLSDEDLDYFGEFSIVPDTPIGSISALYGFPVPEEEAGISTGDFLKKHLTKPLGRGDRMLLGDVELIIRDMDPETGELSIGLALEPSVPAAAKSPAVQRAQEFLIIARARLWHPLPGKRDKTDA